MKTTIDEKTVESTQDQAIEGVKPAKKAEKPAKKEAEVEQRRLLTVCKKGYDLDIIEKATRDAMAHAGRLKSLASDAGFTRSIREIDGKAIELVTPSAVNHLIKAGVIQRASGNQILAVHKLLDALEVLLLAE